MSVAEPRFVADRMLVNLAHRLRLLGYDCTIGREDARSGVALFKEARQEGRTFITASRLLAAEAPGEIVLVPPEGLAEQTKVILNRFPIDFARRRLRAVRFAMLSLRP